MADAPIDWSAHDRHPEHTCTCRCDFVFRSHTKFVGGERPGIVSHKPCPGCGRTDDLRRASSDPETMAIGGNGGGDGDG